MTKVIWVDSQEEFEKYVAEHDEVVVDFSAPEWCNPCKQLAPHYDAASEKSDATFLAVDVDNAPWAMEEYGIRGVPTVMHFKNGKYEKNLLERTAIKLLAEIA